MTTILVCVVGFAAGVLAAEYIPAVDRAGKWVWERLRISPRD